MRSTVHRYPIVALTVSVILGLGLGVGLGQVRRTPQSASPADWVQIFDQTAPTVLLVEASESPPRLGTGFAISDDEVLTARHLVMGAEQVQLRDATGRIWSARVLGTDARTDLALLKVIDGNLTPASLGQSRSLRVGAEVAAIGNPFGLGHSLSTGVVAHLDRRLEQSADGPRVDFVQLSIPLNPGNSGGPVFDTQGQVVAVLAGTHTQGQGIAFGVPVEVLLADLPALRTGTHISRAFLGLRAQPSEGGLLVADVVASSPADRAGILPGDALSAVAGESVITRTDLTALLDHLPGGETISVRLLRDGAVVVVDVVLGDWAEQPVVIGGMTLRSHPGSGGIVVAVRPRSRAERAGIVIGDTVRRVNGLPVRAPAEVRNALTGSPSAQVELARDNVALIVSI